jgi:hypothetical protein
VCHHGQQPNLPAMPSPVSRGSRHAIMPTLPTRPPRTSTSPHRRRARRALASLLAAWLVAGMAWSGGLATTPYRSLVDDLLERFHAVVRPCRMALDDADLCFLVQPAHVALLAEALEAFIVDHAGSVVRGSWTSANGAHRVILKLTDETWGALELWLAERPDRVVEGWFERRPRPRD